MDRERFAAFLNLSCTEFYLYQFESSNLEKFKACVYCELPGTDYDNQCARFMGKFSRSTRTSWISVERLGECVMYHFKKTFLCQIPKKNEANPTADSDNPDEAHCSARISLKWKLINVHTTKKDANLKKNLSCMIYIMFEHSHTLKSTCVLANLGCSKTTDELFESYFSLGLSPGACRVYHDISLAGSSSYFNMSKQDLLEAQASVSTRHLLYLHKLWQRKQHNIRPPIEKLRAKKKAFEKHGYYINLDKSTLEVTIITPLMVGVLKEVANEEKLSVFILSSESHLDIPTWPSRNLFFIFVPSKMGALPIACVIHKAGNFIVSLDSLKSYIETVTDRPFTPSAFHTNDSPFQQTCITKVFPKAKVFLCSSALILSAWKWMFTPKLSLALECKRLILLQFKKLVKAQTMLELHDCYRQLNELTSNCQMVKKYFDNWWFRRNEWSYVYRKKYCKDDDCFVPCESSLRTFNDVILQKGKDFTDEAWIETVCIHLECYYKKRVEDYADNIEIKSHFSMFCQPTQGLLVTKISDHDFDITLSGERLKYPKCKVNFNLVPTCDCEKNGNFGKFCGHLSAIQEEFIWPASKPDPLENTQFFKRLASAIGKRNTLVPNSVQNTKDCLDPLEHFDVVCKKTYDDDFNSDREIDTIDIDETTIKLECKDHDATQVKIKTEHQNILLEETSQDICSTEGVPFELVTVKDEPIEKEDILIPARDPLGNDDSDSDSTQKLTLLPGFKKLGAIQKLYPVKEPCPALTKEETRNTDSYKKMTEQKCIVAQIKLEFDRVTRILDSSLITCRENLKPLYEYHNMLAKIRSSTDAVEFMEANARGQMLKMKDTGLGGHTLRLKRKDSGLGGHTLKSEQEDRDSGDAGKEKRSRLN